MFSALYMHMTYNSLDIYFIRQSHFIDGNLLVMKIDSKDGLFL